MAHTQHTTKCLLTQTCQALALFSLLTLGLRGRLVESQAGWFACPCVLPSLPTMGAKPRSRPRSCSAGVRLRRAWRYGVRSWPQPCVRGLILVLLWTLGGKQWPVWIIGWPWLLWVWQVMAVFWPELGGQPLWRAGQQVLCQGQRVVMVVALGFAFRQVRQVGGDAHGPSTPLLFGLGCQYCGREEPWVEVQHDEDGSYQATLCGHFTIRVPGDHPFRVRMLMLFLRLLHPKGTRPGPSRRSRRTRDGRTPFVRQVQAAQWFKLPHPDISRVEGYWYRGAWPELFSQNTPEILTPELVGRVAKVCATFPWWCQDEVYEHLQDQGVALSRRQVRQAMEQSGWSTLRQELRQRFRWTKGSFRLREKWMVQELLRLVHQLQTCLETGQTLPAEEQVALADLQMLAREVGVEVPPPPKAQPWLWQVEQVLFGQWEEVQDDTVRCPACRSTHAVRKSRKPRAKKYYDAEGNLQEVPVYRYRCDCMSLTIRVMPWTMTNCVPEHGRCRATDLTGSGCAPGAG